MPETVKFIKESHSFFSFFQIMICTLNMALLSRQYHGTQVKLLSYLASRINICTFLVLCVCGYYIQLFQYSLSEISVKVHMTTHKVTMGRSRQLLHGLNTLSDITWQKSFLTLPFCSASFCHTKLKKNFQLNLL